MSPSTPSNSFNTLSTLETAQGEVSYHRLYSLEALGFPPLDRLPFSIKVLLEAALRAENGNEVTREDVVKLAEYDPARPAHLEIPFKPARVLVQDFTGVPAVVDLAALRSAMQQLGGNPSRVNPEIPVDLVIDHSVQVDYYGSADALSRNAGREFERNNERYSLLHWGQKAFDNFRVVPPATGICHQVNLEYLAAVVQSREIDGRTIAFPDSLVGLDSHTTMINGLGVLGWGVGGIEAEAVMLGQPVYMLMPKVVGLRLTGKLPTGSTATDLALVVTEMLRNHGVVGRFVEFFGEGLASISLADRATIANMAPEYGATCGFFPVDNETLRYLQRSGRPAELVDLVERYTREQGLFRSNNTPDPQFFEELNLDLNTVRPCLAGPRRPQDRIELPNMKASWEDLMQRSVADGGFGRSQTAPRPDDNNEPGDGAVVLAAITSCTNTSNPSVMLAAGLLAKKAVQAGLVTRSFVKTSLAPGSKVVTDYLEETGLQTFLNHLGFHTVGYGCTTCIGNSGPLPERVAHSIDQGNLVVASVLSGNRNFEGRIHSKIRANFLASPPLVVAYALAGRVDIDFDTEPLGQAADGRDVFLKELWPRAEEINELLDQATDPVKFRRVYDNLLTSNEQWNNIPSPDSDLFGFQESSTYIHEPPFFTGLSAEHVPDIIPIDNARVLVKVADSVTTDHISPAGAIAEDSPAGIYLRENGVSPSDFNSYGSRRGNDRIMTRGTFANVRLRNQLAGGREGGWTTHIPSGEIMSIYETSQLYQAEGTPSIVLAGIDYGMGSSRDWAAKGTFLLGIKAVIAASFERIHRSNLVGMGVLPLQFKDSENAKTLGLDGSEQYSIALDNDLKPGQTLTVQVLNNDGKESSFSTVCRLDTPVELQYFRNGGILHTVLRRMLGEK